MLNLDLDTFLNPSPLSLDNYSDPAYLWIPENCRMDRSRRSTYPHVGWSDRANTCRAALVCCSAKNLQENRAMREGREEGQH